MIDVDWIEEPKLLFQLDQKVEAPKDGLALFGPLDEQKVYGVRAGVIGTTQGIRRFRDWVKSIQSPIFNDRSDAANPYYPGFEALFGIKWNPTPSLALEVDEKKLQEAVRIADGHRRVYATVDVYAQQIRRAIREEEAKVDVWFIVVPEEVYRYCRPNSKVPKEERIETEINLSETEGKKIATSEPTMFDDINEAAIPYEYEINFHNQLKARLLDVQGVTQILRESTIAPYEHLNGLGNPIRGLGGRQAEIAWNLTTTIFYKVGGRPWKTADIRDGVCYVGLVFKRDERRPDPRTACCAAQMFLDSGDGVVFKGALGPWYSPDKDEYRLPEKEAQKIVRMAVEAYKDKNRDEGGSGAPPKEMFIHGKTDFDREEWDGFQKGAAEETNVVAVKIRNARDLKLFRQGDNPVLRGTAYHKNEEEAFLWTKGFIPRLQTYPGREVPNPLYVQISKGSAEMRTVLEDIMALTKLNYNTCNFSDGEPVTLKFADAVGEVLTAAPLEDDPPPLPFRHYI
jgi:hypothetical protein